MKYRTSIIALALLALAFASCSRHSPDQARPAKAVAFPKEHDLGVIEISDGVTSRQDLGDGKTCIITPSLLKDGSILLSMTVEKSGKVLASPRAQTRPDVPVVFSIGDIVFALTPHIKQ